MRSHRSSFGGRVTAQIRVSEGHLSLSPLHLLNCRHFESIIFRCSRNYSGRLNVILGSVFEASVVAVRVKRGEEGWLGPAPWVLRDAPQGKEYGPEVQAGGVVDPLQGEGRAWSLNQESRLSVGLTFLHLSFFICTPRTAVHSV